MVMIGGSAKEPIASIFYDHSYTIDKKQHAIERIRELFVNSLHYKKSIMIADYGIMQYFSSKFLSNEIKPYVIFFHGTTSNNKHWPECHWRELLISLTNKGLIVKLPWISNIEYQRVTRLAQGFDHVEILPKLSLKEMAYQIINANVIVSVDTGLSHLTAALGKPNIILYGPTDPRLVGGYGKEQEIIIAKNYDMATIKPNVIYKKLLLKIDN